MFAEVKAKNRCSQATSTAPGVSPLAVPAASQTASTSSV